LQPPHRWQAVAHGAAAPPGSIRSPRLRRSSSPRSGTGAAGGARQGRRPAELEGRRPAVRLRFVAVGGCRGPGTTSGTPASADRPRRSFPGRASAVGWTFKPLGTGSGLFANEGFRVGRRSSGTGHGPRPGGMAEAMAAGWLGAALGCRRPAGWVGGVGELRTQQVGQSEELAGLSPSGSRRTSRRRDGLIR
jgi:hypothetical protein